MAHNESYPQHVVTAVLVAHDGTAWLSSVVDALLGQTRPVQRVVAVDTGSRDRSGAELTGLLGQSVVFGMDRSTGYGAAVAAALRHKAARTAIPAPQDSAGRDQTEWIWLLHDDCEPAPDALEQLLRGAAEVRSAGVLGPKVRDWSTRDVLLEAGLTIDTVGRRITGIEPREVDQGQHDGDRDVLAVSTAGMLIRRDIWDQVGGFDPAMPLLMDDVDFCWRVHSAGYRVRLVTDAVVYHAQATSRRRRAVSLGRRPPMLERRHALLTLLGNLPGLPAVRAAAANLAVSLLRVTFFLVAKRPAAALDEAAAVLSVGCHPVRLLRARRQRAPGRRAAYGSIRADLPPGRSVRRVIEFAFAAMSSGQSGTVGSHHASSEDPADDESLLVDSGLLQRLLASPVLWLTGILTVIALVAERRLLGSGPLTGGSLTGVWGGASDLWHTAAQAFHPDGLGSAGPAPPYIAVLALLATVLGGKPWLAIDVILLGCVPLAGVSAFLAARRLVRSAPVRMWLAACYALLPVSIGVVAGARFGSAVAFELLPLAGVLAARTLAQTGRRARRAAWATGLVITVAAMFAPLVWLLTIPAAALAAFAARRSRPGLLVNLGIVVLTPPVLLLPWLPQLAAHPSQLLLEAGQPQTGPAGSAARSLMLFSPGGPGVPPFWMAAGIGVAGLAALAAARRRSVIMAGWGTAMAGLVGAILLSRLTVTPASGGSPVTAWSGLPLAVAALGVLVAAAVGAEALGRMLGGRTKVRAAASPRGLWAALIGLVACSAPVLIATWWVIHGVEGPVRIATGPVVPEIVTISNEPGRQLRTLVLRTTAGGLSYALLRGPNPTLAGTSLAPDSPAGRALSRAVAALVAPDGGQAASQASLLANFDIGFVLVRAPVDPRLAHALDNVAGLRPFSVTADYSLWVLQQLPWRVTVAGPGGTITGLPAGPVAATARAPSAGGTLELAEPQGGWAATLNGRPLTPVPSPAGGWAQAFRLPSGGGSLRIAHSQLGMDVLAGVQLLAFAVVAALALPGSRTSGSPLPASSLGTDGGAEPAADADSPRGADGDTPAGRPARPGRRRRRRASPATAGGSRRDRAAAPPEPGADLAVPEQAMAARSLAPEAPVASGGGTDQAPAGRTAPAQRRSRRGRNRRAAADPSPIGPAYGGSLDDPGSHQTGRAAAALDSARQQADTGRWPSDDLGSGWSAEPDRAGRRPEEARAGWDAPGLAGSPSAGRRDRWNEPGGAAGLPDEARPGWEAPEAAGWPPDPAPAWREPDPAAAWRPAETAAGRPAPGPAGRRPGDESSSLHAGPSEQSWDDHGQAGYEQPYRVPDGQGTRPSSPRRTGPAHRAHDNWSAAGESLDPLPPVPGERAPARPGRHGRRHAADVPPRGSDWAQPFGPPDDRSGRAADPAGAGRHSDRTGDDPFGDDSHGDRQAEDTHGRHGDDPPGPQPGRDRPAASSQRRPAPGHADEGEDW